MEILELSLWMLLPFFYLFLNSNFFKKLYKILVRRNKVIEDKLKIKKGNDKMVQDYNWLKYIGFVAFGILVILLLNPFFIVGAGERGVIFNSFSGVKPETFTEGIHLKVPLIETAYLFEVRTKIYESDAQAASKDLQIVNTKVALNYHIDKDKVDVLFQLIGVEYENRIIAPSIQEVVKSITAKHIAEELITQRELVKDEIKEGLKERLQNSYITLDDLSITNFDFSDEFNKAIEQKVTAEQNALKEQNNLKVVEYQAQQKVAQAKGDAEAIRIINLQLQQSPQYIQFKLLEKWNGIMPLSLGGGSLLSIANIPNITG